MWLDVGKSKRRGLLLNAPPWKAGPARRRTSATWARLSRALSASSFSLRGSGAVDRVLARDFWCASSDRGFGLRSPGEQALAVDFGAPALAPVLLLKARRP